MRRTSFLVTPADTCTVYAAQGGTYEAVIADMQRPPRESVSKHWLACYVMLSHARAVEGLLILCPATREELSARPPQYLLDELDGLERLESLSLRELAARINALPIDVPAEFSHILTCLL